MDEELLIRFIIGESDDNESVVAQKWINDSDANRRHFEKLLKVWSAAEDPRHVEPADVNADAAWNKLKARIEQFHEIENKYQGKQRSLSFYLVRVAAVFVFGIFIYNLYKYQDTRLSQVQIASADTTLTNNPLPDGTIISLNQNTIIEYQKEFSETERRVKMNGEAFFDVEPDAKRPFIIEAQDAIITVLGTSFNVKALNEDAAVEVLVEEGIVELANPDKSQLTQLKIGEKGIYLKETKEVKRETDIDVESLYWLNKTLLFRDTDLAVVFETLERLYDVNIKVENDEILNCQLTAKFSNETIDKIIEHISTIFELKTEKEANNILIKGNGCH
jgi:ferric-dicitrate binding protein FerR (iron transport regulator)